MDADMFACKDENLTEMLKEYALANKIEKEARSIYNDAKEAREVLEQSLFIAMENAGFQNIKTEDGTFFRRVDTYCSIKKEALEDAYRWLHDHDLGSLIQETVNARTLTATMKEYIDQGGQVPEQLINLTTKNRIGVRR